jgi:hypothetical protein
VLYVDSCPAGAGEGGNVSYDFTRPSRQGVSSVALLGVYGAENKSITGPVAFAICKRNTPRIEGRIPGTMTSVLELYFQRPIRAMTEADIKRVRTMEMGPGAASLWC